MLTIKEAPYRASAIATATRLPRYALQRIEDDDHRRYDSPCGVVRSVTTVLDQTKNKEHLIAWSERLGVEASDRSRRLGTRRGNWCHEQIENYCVYGTLAERNWSWYPWWQCFEQYVAPRLQETWLTEYSVWHPSGYAGTADWLGLVDGKVTLCDWKTSGQQRSPRWFSDYKLQAAAYTHATEHVYREEHGIEVEQAIVFVLLRAQAPQIIELDRKKIEAAYKRFQARLGDAASANP